MCFQFEVGPNEANKYVLPLLNKGKRESVICAAAKLRLKLSAGSEEGISMAGKKRKSDPVVAVAKVAIAMRLITRLEAAHRNGMLKPVNPEAKPASTEIRVKAK